MYFAWVLESRSHITLHFGAKTGKKKTKKKTNENKTYLPVYSKKPCTSRGPTFEKVKRFDRTALYPYNQM